MYLADIYLNSQNPIAQLTVGIEAGQEGAIFYDEYKRQIQYLKQLQEEGEIVILSMKSIAKEYMNQFPSLNPGVFISGTDYLDRSIEAYWYSSRYYRIGLIKQNDKLTIRDFRIYPDYLLDNDFIENDVNHELKRIIPSVIDEALNNNSKLLFSDISAVNITKNDDETILSLDDKNGKRHLLSLSENKILVDRTVLFEKIPKYRFTDDLNKFLAGIITEYWLSYPDLWMPSWRFSKINNTFYFGFMASPEYLVGIRSEFPFFGSFQFPFQTLVRFKSFPRLGIAEFISDYLVKSINNSTIKVSDQHLL